MPVAGDLKFTSLSGGPESTCGIVVGGDIYCWGGSEVIGGAIAPRPVQQGFGFVGLDYGGVPVGIACAEDGAGALYCFLYIWYKGASEKTMIATPDIARQFSVGGVWTPNVALPYMYQIHYCLVDTTDSVACWGANTYGQLGDGTTTDHQTPAIIPQLDSVAQVTAGGAHSCAVTRSGEAYCWGANSRGQLGIGKAGAPVTAPRLVAPPLP